MNKKLLEWQASFFILIAVGLGAWFSSVAVARPSDFDPFVAFLSVGFFVGVALWLWNLAWKQGHRDH